MKFVVFILTIGSVRRNFPSGLLYNFVYIYIYLFRKKKKVLLSYNFQLIQLIKEMCLKSFIVTISCPTNQHDSTNQKKTKSYFPHETSMGFTTFRHLLGDVLGMRLPEVINLAARKMTIYSLIVLPNFH